VLGLTYNYVRTLLDAPPCDVDEAARATPKQAAYRFFAEAVDMARQAEIEVVEGLRLSGDRRNPAKRILF